MLLMVTGISSAQSSPDFSGYVYDLPIYMSTNDNLARLYGTKPNQILNLTRLRLHSEYSPWRDTFIQGTYEISSVYFESIPGLFMLEQNKTNRQIVDLSWTPVDEEHLIVNHFIDRLSVKQFFSWGEMEIGRQRIAWGSGRIWNPTDLFNPINPANFYKVEKDGADAVSATYYLGSFSDLNVVFNLSEKLKNSNYGFRLRTNYQTYDIAMIGGYFDNRVIGGLDFAGNFFDAGLRGEGIASFNENNYKDSFLKYILGIDYQFTSKLYALLEYHYNGEGKTNKFNYQFRRLINGEILNLSKNYIAASVQYQLHPLLSLTLTNTTNLEDKSGFLSGEANYSLTEDIYLKLGGQYFFGDDFTEYWYYSNTAYLQGEYYF